jgi:UDP-2,3-diacylglucosamine pyrophosphatase LpxH
MRLSLEDTLYDHGVDVVISGHVHSYERTFNVYKNKVWACSYREDRGDALLAPYMACVRVQGSATNDWPAAG